jgi:hypothetical protein
MQEPFQVGGVRAHQLVHTLRNERIHPEPRAPPSTIRPATAHNFISSCAGLPPCVVRPRDVRCARCLTPSNTPTPPCRTTRRCTRTSCRTLRRAAKLTGVTRRLAAARVRRPPRSPAPRAALSRPLTRSHFLRRVRGCPARCLQTSAAAIAGQAFWTRTSTAARASAAANPSAAAPKTRAFEPQLTSFPPPSASSTTRSRSLTS